MAKYKYNFYPINTEDFSSTANYPVEDNNLLVDFSKVASFDQAKNYIELHYYTLDGTLLKSVYPYTNISAPQDSESANKGTLNSINLDLEKDLIQGGFNSGDVNLVYNFLNDLYSPNLNKKYFFIDSISADRTEVLLIPVDLEQSIVEKQTLEIKQKLSESDFSEFHLNFDDNRILTGVNIDLFPHKGSTAVIIKLNKPAPKFVKVKETTSLAEKISDPVAYNSEAEIIPEVIKVPQLKGPNFYVDQETSDSQASQYFTINDLFTYPLENNYYQVKSLFKEKGIELSIDYSSFENFIHFSSAEERILNFKYKVDLLKTYQDAIDELESASNTASGISGSRDYYQGLIDGIVENFDHYDRFLYYTSGSHSWPKTNTEKPFTLATGATTGSWYNEKIRSGSDYDSTNSNLLENTIPEFLREDSNNAKYVTFIHMIGQHFDNLWLYGRAVSDKYDSDNRLDSGISKDLVKEALKSFGIRLYSSNKSTQDLFEMFTGQVFDTGSEEIETVYSASNDIISEEDYRKQIYKRLYHNLPLITKAKGTERGLRAVLSSFGIPSLYSSGSHAGLRVTNFGGNFSGSYNAGNLTYSTSSIDKIQIDNTGSIVDGNTLSQYTSIVKPDDRYYKNLNIVEAGFSPAEYINRILLHSASAAGFDIDDIIGDPRLRYSNSYDDLKKKAETYLSGSNRYDLKDFIRVLKYYDNVIFKSIKDYTPARANVAAGAIIKPHLFERPKIAQPLPILSDETYSGSLAIGIRSGSHGDSFGSRDQYTAAYSESRESVQGMVEVGYHTHEEAKYDGEFSGSSIVLSTGELNDENIYKYESSFTATWQQDFIDNAIDCTVIWEFYTPSVTATPTGTPTNTPTNTPTSTPTNTPTNTLTEEAPATPTNTPSSTPTQTPTSTPTGTPTSTPTSTPVPVPTGHTTSLNHQPTKSATNQFKAVWTGTGFSQQVDAQNLLKWITGESSVAANTSYNVAASSNITIYDHETPYASQGTIGVSGATTAKYFVDPSQTVVQIDNCGPFGGNIAGGTLTSDQYRYQNN